MFTLTGGSVYYACLIGWNDRETERLIDEGGYAEEQLLEVKIPVRVAYYSSTPGYERYYGEAEYNGNYYTYVKRKVSNDTIYLLCIPNYTKTALQQCRNTAGALAAGAANDAPVKGGQVLAKKDFGFSDYEPDCRCTIRGGAIDPKKMAIPFQETRYKDPGLTEPGRPPEPRAQFLCGHVQHGHMPAGRSEVLT